MCFLLRLGLSNSWLVFLAYGKLAWSFLLTVETPFGLFAYGGNYIPPPLPPFPAKGHFSGQGVGVYILSPQAAGILHAPLLYPPPTP